MSETRQPQPYPLIHVSSKNSLIHIGSLDSFDITDGGKAAARCILDYFDHNNAEKLKRAVDIYDNIIPNENFGGEYTALQWICRLILAPEYARADFLSHAEVAAWFDYLSAGGYAKLKEYLSYKYHFVPLPDDGGAARRNLRFLEDFILFSNPDRNRWENTLANISKFDIRPGDTIADIGAGPGYFSFKFADMAGGAGKVYAIETNPMHLDYLHKFIQQYNIKNVEVVECCTDDIGLAPDIKVDLVFMCSLYHVLYAALTEEERVSYIGGIIRALRPGGKLIIVDNDLVEGGNLPYHGPYIAKDLIISQLFHYGFTLRDNFQFTVQRYALIFEYTGEALIADAGNSPASDDLIQIKSRSSLVNYRIADAAPTAGFTPKGQAAAAVFLEALETRSRELIQKALDTYRELIPTERIGDEYTAFEWICRYLGAGEKTRDDMLADDMARVYFDFLYADNFSILKNYLKAKYELAKSGAADRSFADLGKISEYIAFNNPNRDSWEHTEEMLAYMDLRPGRRVADIGSGSGYFTYRFAKAVGRTGMVYATEINKEALSYVEDMRSRFDLPIQPIVSRLNDAGLPADSADVIFMCSMYHAVYIASIEFVKDAFIASVRKALKKDGKLFVVDNEIALPGVVPYYGSAISRDLVIAQLRHYGFILTETRQFIPQRYLLVFQKNNLYD